jgi:hypothetical protein
VPHGFTIGRVGNGVTDLRIAVLGMDAAHGWIFVLDPNGVQIEIVGPEL